MEGVSFKRLVLELELALSRVNAERAYLDIMRGVVVSTSPHSGFFYVLTAAHAAHVVGGLVGLWFLAVWQRHQWKFTTVSVLSRVTAVYWHFLGILWLTMFLMLKFWR